MRASRAGCGGEEEEDGRGDEKRKNKTFVKGALKQNGGRRQLGEKINGNIFWWLNKA